MVWQQWVFLIWMVIRIPFGIHREITRPLKDVPPERESRSRTIGILTYMFIHTALIALVVTI